MVNVKRDYWKILVIVAFIVLSVFVGINHEHWADEAQSFLLARDTSLTEILGYMKYEGTPSLWVMVIKLFLLLGGTYETFFILPIICTTIGLILFEFKTNAPWYIKILFPFTYFIFYQYSIVARSYCLVFPLLMIISMVYEKRFEKTFLYAIVLFFFMSISLHTLVIAGSLYLIYLIEIVKDKKYKEKKIIVVSVLLFMLFLFTALCTYPASDCSFNGNGGRPIQHILSESTIGKGYDNIIEIVITILIITIFILSLKDDNKWNIIQFFILFVPVIAILMFIDYKAWHIGIITILLFVYCTMTNKINENEFIKLFLVFVCITQIYWTVSSCIYDLDKAYSGSKELAEFIQTYYDYEDLTIYGLGYSATALKPYFEDNIFVNENTEKGFHLWKDNNGYMSNEEMMDKKADIYIISKFYFGNYYDDLYKPLNYSGEYHRYEFDGYTYIKNDVFEPEGFFVLINNNVEAKFERAK